MPTRPNYIRPLALPALEACCSTDDLRPAMMFIEFKNGIATCTNAHVLIRYNLASCLDDETVEALNTAGYIHGTEWAWIRRQKPLYLTAVKNDAGRVSLEFRTRSNPNDRILSLMLTPMDAEYPNYQRIMPPLEQENRISTISLNPAKLQQLMKAMGTSDVEIRLPDRPTRPILVLSHREDVDAMGLVMPIDADRHRDGYPFGKYERNFSKFYTDESSATS